MKNNIVILSLIALQGSYTIRYPKIEPMFEWEDQYCNDSECYISD